MFILGDPEEQKELVIVQKLFESHLEAVWDPEWVGWELLNG